MAAAADGGLPLSPGNRISTSKAAEYDSPDTVLDFGAFVVRKTAEFKSSTTCSFDTLHGHKQTEPSPAPEARKSNSSISVNNGIDNGTDDDTLIPWRM